MGLSVEVNNLLLGGDAGYRIERSVRLRRSASAYFNRNIATAPTLSTRYTLSFWLKRGQLSLNQGIFGARQSPSPYELITFETGDTIFWQSNNGLGVRTSAVYRDPGAWYHFIFVMDTTEATAANRAKMFVNGVQQTYSTASYPTLNSSAVLGSAIANWIGGEHNGSGITSFFDGYIAEVNFIDGQALPTSSFGYTDSQTGVWTPRRYTGTYGTNGYYLKFTDNSAATATTIGRDFSGNGNNWTPTNVSVTLGSTYDSMLDSPTNYADGGNGRGNYCVMNAVSSRFNSSDLLATYSNANLQTNNSGTGTANVVGTVGSATGRFYYEATCNGNSGSGNIIIGFNSPNPTYNGNQGLRNNGVLEGLSLTSGAGFSYTTNDIIGVAADIGAKTCIYYKNGVQQFTANMIGGNINLTAWAQFNGSADSFIWNFGQRPFTYTPPSGYRALNTQNIPTPSIQNGATWMDATAYSGNSTIQNVVNSGAMQPDLVWIKARSQATDNIINDSARGAGTYVISNLNNAETTNTIIFSAFNSNGFQVNNASQTNATGQTYVGWQWKEGVVPGLDIVLYTGNGSSNGTAHNLGVRPNMVFYKRRSSSQDWGVIHSSLPDNGSNAFFMRLNTNTAQEISTTTFPLVGWSSTQIPLGTNVLANASGQTYVAYAFAAVPGFSAFGSYVGNASTDGPFAWCGFRPRWVMIRAAGITENWLIHDTARDPFNVSARELIANATTAEGSTTPFDILSNGIKIRSSLQGLNQNGTTYIYAAFAENPFKIARAR